MADHRENPIQATLAGFIDYAKSLKGDEKGEAQVFCDRLFKAFGHIGCQRGTTIAFFGVRSFQSTQLMLERATYGIP